MLPLVILSLLAAVGSVPTQDLVEKLPGWSHEIPSRIFSGFVDAGVSCQKGTCYTMHEHYVFIESENSPLADPVVLWTNGGPGASSLYGLFVELGPFSMSEHSMRTNDFNQTGIPTLFRNDYSWTKFSNLLIINSPPPVGFSYCDPAGPSGDGQSCGVWDDTRTTEHNLIFLKNWFRSFPEYQKNKFYLTGESYAGIYIPSLAREIVSDPSPEAKLINLAGWAVGDACVGAEVNCGGEGPYFTVEFLHGHGQFSDETYQRIHAKCNSDELMFNLKQSKPCQAALDQMGQEVGGFYVYALYDECFYTNDFSRLTRPAWSHRLWPAVPPPAAASKPRHGDGGRTAGYACGGDAALTLWVQQPAVRVALHVPADGAYFSGDNGEGFDYRPTEADLRPWYRQTAEAGKLRVLVYNGDADPAVNSLQAANWTRSIGLERVEAWRPWTTDGRQAMAGYLTRYAGMDFTTIRGSGHMVPLYKPIAAFSMLSSWLAGDPLPAYLPPNPPSKGEHDDILAVE